MPMLTVLMGPPGAGKTTWTEAHAAGQVVCGTDRLRTDPRLRGAAATVAYLDRLRAKAEQGLHAGQDVLVDACNVHARERTRWLALARRCHASTHLVILHAPMPTLLAVQRARTHAVPEAKMASYQQAFERALTCVSREGWARITHVHREHVEPKPRRVSSW